MGLHVDQAFGFYACRREVEALQAPLQRCSSGTLHARNVLGSCTPTCLPPHSHSMLLLAPRHFCCVSYVLLLDKKVAAGPLSLAAVVLRGRDRVPSAANQLPPELADTGQAGAPSNVTSLIRVLQPAMQAGVHLFLDELPDLLNSRAELAGITVRFDQQHGQLTSHTLHTRRCLS